MKRKIYLDDVRTPNGNSWIIVRSYNEFVSTIKKIGLENIDIISLDHDLGDTAMEEFYNNVETNNELDYNNIIEKTGYDAAKWLVDQWIDGENLVNVVVHSANPVGSANIINYINGYRKSVREPQNCIKVAIPHSV